MIGVINVLKPKNLSSSNVVVKIKKLINQKKVGHMGTLDPLASGVLPICIGKATRLFDYFLKKQKTYIATFQFGYETDTLDLEGEVLETSNNIPSSEEVVKATKKLTGTISQVPPIYSSKKVNGKKACDIARSGKDIELKPCKVEIFNFDILEKIDDKTYKFVITCSAGTYIRAIARDLAELLNTKATMIDLIRTKAGNFCIEDAVPFEELTKEKIEKNIISIEEVCKDFEKIEIDEKQFLKLLNGQNLIVQSCNKENLAIYCGKNIVGLGDITGRLLKIKTFLYDEKEVKENG